MFLSPALLVIVFIVGALIGSMGIGGVLLVPSLKYFGDVAIHTAIPACMLSYIMTGAIGTMMYARHGTINWGMAGWVCIGALPGALFGAVMLPYFSATALESGIAALAITSGIQALRQQKHSGADEVVPGSIMLCVIGAVAGAGSSLSGTGGPLLLIPILIWCKVPMLTAIGLSQVIQIPIATTATIGNLIVGDLDWRLGVTLAVVMIGGSLAGAKLAHVLPVSFLKKIVASLLVAVGVAMLLKLSGIL